MAFEHGGGFRQSMREIARLLELPEGNGPAVLPVERQSGQGQDGQDNAAEGAISNAMQCRQQGGLTGHLLR